MHYGICDLSIIPVRREPSDKSEMTTQLLFGEHFTILDRNAKWVLVKNAFDGYEGWIGAKQYSPVDEEEFFNLNEEPLQMIRSFVDTVELNGTNIPVVCGSVLPHFTDGLFSIGKKDFQFRGETISTRYKGTRPEISETAFTYLNAPYLWGGKGPFGIDCSGFTQMVFRMNGIFLKRDSYDQSQQGISLSFVEEALPGDLAFFDNEEGKIIHVGIILADSLIIHASGKVRVDRLDHHGIFNVDTKSYSHQLRVIRRVL